MLLDEVLRALVREECRKVFREELERALSRTSSPAAGDEYLTFADAAKVVDVSVGTIRNWVKRGLLHSCGPAGSPRFRRRDLDRVMSSKPSKAINDPEVADQIAAVLGRRRSTV